MIPLSITIDSIHKAPLTVSFIIYALTLLSPLSSVQGSKSSSYDSGYDHRCDDARIPDSYEKYINQDEKGPSYHTGKFMRSHYAGVNSCSSSSGPSNQNSESRSSSLDPQTCKEKWNVLGEFVGNFLPGSQTVGKLAGGAICPPRN